jgi:hypothetical protein
MGRDAPRGDQALEQFITTPGRRITRIETGIGNHLPGMQVSKWFHRSTNHGVYSPPAHRAPLVLQEVYVGEAEKYREDGRGGSETPSRCVETHGAESSNMTGPLA